MKWLVVIALGLLLVFVCVEYLQREKRLSAPPSAIPVVTQTLKLHKTARLMTAKATPPGPVDISGPLKDRGLVHWVLPEYPDWAQEQGIAGVLRMKIWVTPVGQVQSFTEPQQLSGDPRLDEKAVQALRQWEFEGKPNSFGDQWGVVTIRFSLLSKGEDQPYASVRGFSLGKTTTSGAWECVRKWVGGAENEFVYICRHRLPLLNAEK